MTSRWSHGTEGSREFRGAARPVDHGGHGVFGAAPCGTGGYGEPMRLADTVAAALLARLPGDVGAAVFRRGEHTLVGVDPDEVVVGNGPTRSSLDSTV